MDRDHSCGIIPVYATAGQPRQYLLVQHKAGHWGFPKGHPENDETTLETALRELKEETGLTPDSLIDDVPFAERYIFRKRSGKVVDKNVTYFIGFIATTTVDYQDDELQDAAWGDLDATLERMSFEEGRKLLLEVHAFLDRDASRTPAISG